MRLLYTSEVAIGFGRAIVAAAPGPMVPVWLNWTLLLNLAAIAFVIFSALRQMSWVQFDSSQLLRPAQVLGVISIVLVFFVDNLHIGNSVNFLVLLASAIAAGICGLLTGRLTKIREAPAQAETSSGPPARKGFGRLGQTDDKDTRETIIGRRRSGPWGTILQLVLAGVLIAIAAAGHELGASLAGSFPFSLFGLAVGELCSGLVILRHLGRSPVLRRGR